MHGKYIERVINFHPHPQNINRNIAGDAASQTQNQPARHADETGCRGDCCQTGDHAGDDANKRGTAKSEPFDTHPDKRCGGSGNMGDQKRHASTVTSRQRRTTVKAKPADPQHAGTNHCQDRRMWRIHGLWKITALANNQGADQSG